MRLFTFLITAVLASTTANAQSDAAKSFGMREGVEEVRLSPDGARVLFLAPQAGQATAVYVSELPNKQPKRLFTVDGNPERLTGCNWVTSLRMVCSIALTGKDLGLRVGHIRRVAVNADGSAPKVLAGGGIIDWLPDADGAVLTMFGGQVGNTGTGAAVGRLDTMTNRIKLVERPKLNAVEYITDGRGVVRIMGISSATETGYATGVVRYSYRPVGSDQWTALSTVDADGKGFNPYAVDPALNVAYGFDQVDGRAALFKLALDDTRKREMILVRSDVDVDRLIRVGRAHRVVGASFATERREAQFFDPDYRAISQSLRKALPGLPLIRFVDASADEKKLLLWAGSDVDPGRYFVFDRPTKQLGEILVVRPQLENAKLSTVKPVSIQASDGTAVPGYLTLPVGRNARGIPAIVMPHGGPGARDEWGFDWLAQFYAARGFAVLQPNFRGSTGYGEQWFADNGFKSWRTAIGDVNDAGRWLVSEGIADPARLAIVGWSYGGYAALQSAALDPSLFKAIVAIAPVTDLAELKADARPYTSGKLVSEFIGSGPHVVQGSPSHNVRAIRVPVLLFHGDVDVNVDINHSRIMEKRLRDAGKQVELVTYPKLDHQIDDSAARTDMLDRSDRFLKTALSIDAAAAPAVAANTTQH